MHLITITHLFYMLIPISIVAYVYFLWTQNIKEIVLATFRMLTQLLIIGYCLTFIFNNNHVILGFVIILFMIGASSFIALRNIEKRNLKVYYEILLSIAIGGSFNLLLVLYFVLDLHPFYQPRFIIPLAGMIYANSMNAISLVAERFENEIKNKTYPQARANAFKASLIPQINSFLAVGLVSLPGMMTGQILSGIDPIIAVRYQIVVMAMVLGSAGMSSIIYLYQQGKKYGISN
ncbi:ABC transporter permease [Sulfurospirillum sp. 1612]|uniref:ABC transporter permease n=1 Tax=Sulfurospirillum sp. 1612 TaxID=3094835 RepID=UPI002F92509E